MSLASAWTLLQRKKPPWWLAALLSWCSLLRLFSCLCPVMLKKVPSMADAAQAIENEQLTAEQQAAAEKGTLGMRISAEGYDAETASPAIAHISGTSDAGEAVDFCTALTLNASTRVQIDPGAYEVEIIAPINADGSIFEAPEPFKAVVKASGIAEVAKKLTFVPAADAADAASSAASKVAQAMAMNDGTIADNAVEVAAKNAAVAS